MLISLPVEGVRLPNIVVFIWSLVWVFKKHWSHQRPSGSTWEFFFYQNLKNWAVFIKYRQFFYYRRPVFFDFSNTIVCKSKFSFENFGEFFTYQNQLLLIYLENHKLRTKTSPLFSGGNWHPKKLKRRMFFHKILKIFAKICSHPQKRVCQM
jgi:hypothetical protein